MKTSKRILNILFVAALILAIFPISGFAEGLSVGNGHDSNAIMKAGVRFRNFKADKGTETGTEVYLGDPDDFSGNTNSNRVEIKDLSWGNSNHFKLTYSPDDYSLTVNVNGKSATKTFTAPLIDLNYVKLAVARRSSGNNKPTVDLESFTVDGELTKPSTFEGDGLHTWSIFGIDLSGGFTIEGDITLSGSQKGGENDMVEIGVGYSGVIPYVKVTPNPVFLNTSAQMTALVYQEKGIALARYRFNDGEWQEIEVSNSPTSVDMIVDFIASHPGDNTVCVDSIDKEGNFGEEACANFSVYYKFYGFDEPVNPDPTIVNEVKAGRAVPIKWYLTDGNDIPIEDESSFVGTTSSYLKTCDGDTLGTSPIEEVAAGESGLQNLGDGYYQLNWKTSKDWVGSCYILYIQFDSVQDEGGVEFQFK